MTAHFNLVVLSNETDVNKPRMPRSLKPLLLMQNRQPQLRMRRPTLRYPVTVTLQIVNAKKQHPTGAVTLTCRREYGLVNRIPAGYETDDSWDNDSHTHEHTHTHT